MNNSFILTELTFTLWLSLFLGEWDVFGGLYTTCHENKRPAHCIKEPEVNVHGYLGSPEIPKDPIFDLGVLYFETLKQPRFWSVVYLSLEYV